MMKELKNASFLLASSILLAACGTATDGTPEDNTPPDTTSPVITKIEPNILALNGGSEVIQADVNQLVFTFDEPLAPETVSALTFGFITSEGNELKGTWSYSEKSEGNTSYDLTFSFDFSSLGANLQTLPLDETFTLNFNNAVKDTSGNGLANYRVSFSTPQAYNISVITTGLPTDSQIEVRVENLTVSNNNSTSIIMIDGRQALNASLATGSSFSLSVNQQPNEDTFCAFTEPTGVINGSDRNVTLNCSNVVPYYSAAPNWNSYGVVNIKDANGNDIPTPYIHGGEKRKFAMDNLNNCDGLTIADDLNAFEWACLIDDTTTPTQTIIYSTQLKDGMYLSDLLNFSRDNPSWKTNSVSVKQADDIELNQNKRPAIWWGNPVIIPNASVLTLSTTGTVYIIPDNAADVTHRYLIQGTEISLVINPDIILTPPQSNSASVAINGTYNWFEGKLDANNSNYGILVSNSFYTQLRNVDVTNATLDGIQLLNSETTYLIRVSSINNDENGLSILGVTSRDVSILGNFADNISLNDNRKNGLNISSTSHSNKLSGITAQRNLNDGVNIALGNYISDSKIINNQGNGLVINGHNNTITLTTASDNVGTGIMFSMDAIEPKNNFVSSVTVTNNGIADIAFDASIANDPAIVDSNTIVNFIDDANINAANENANPLPAQLINLNFVGSSTLYLEHAVELLNDKLGNDNGVCEAGETCLYTPNTGQNQGLGDLIDVPSETLWADENITLKQHNTTTP